MDHPALDGAVALVTEASSVLGAATARRLALEGAAVSLVAPASDRLAVLAEQILSSGGHAVAIEQDITDREQAYGAVQQTLDRFGRLDILVNNAEVRVVSSALHSTLHEWDRMVALNLTALLHVTHAAVPYLIDAATTSPRQVADLVNLGSTAGRVARPGTSVYSLTKSGVVGFSESLRQELVSEGVRVSVVDPGPLGNELLDQWGAAAAAGARRPSEPEQPGHARTVADAIVYIVTREPGEAVDQILLS